jgi:hypothetical protein
MSDVREDIVWLLLKIKYCVEEHQSRKWRDSSKHFIFQGSFDVWETENDGVKYNVLMDNRLKESKDLGLIVNESGNKDWKYNENWHLTDLGEKYLEAVNLTEFRLKGE